MTLEQMTTEGWLGAEWQMPSTVPWPSLLQPQLTDKGMHLGSSVSSWLPHKSGPCSNADLRPISKLLLGGVRRGGCIIRWCFCPPRCRPSLCILHAAEALLQ